MSLPRFSLLLLPPAGEASPGRSPWFWWWSGSRLNLHITADLYGAAVGEPELLLPIGHAEAMALPPLHREAHWRFLTTGSTSPPMEEILETALRQATTDWFVLQPIDLLPTRIPPLGTPSVLHMAAVEGGGGDRRSGNLPAILSCSRQMLERLRTALPAEGVGCSLLGEWLIRDHQAERIGHGCMAGHGPGPPPQARMLRVTTRSFNQIDLYPEAGLVRKCSCDHERLEGERIYLAGVPETLRHYFPRLADPQEIASIPPVAPGRKCLVMEYINLPTLSELYLHHPLENSQWQLIAEGLSGVLREFRDAAHCFVGDASWLYSEKMLLRRQELEHHCNSHAELAALFRQELTINGRPYPAPSRAMEELLEQLLVLEKDCALQFIHGDLCFNNILCGIGPCGIGPATIRLIDPRGPIGQPASPYRPGIGDRRYDLCKLYHSMAKGYDAITNDLFTLHEVSGCIDFAFYKPDKALTIERIFHDHLLAGRLNGSELTVLTASLFFSMLPLHLAKPHQLLGLLCVALECLYSI